MTMMQGLPLTGVSVSSTAKKRGEACLSVCLSHVKAMHRLLAALFDGLENDTSYDDDDGGDTESRDSTTLHKKFADRCFRLVTLMTEPTPGPVEFPLAQIITVLTRCLNMAYPDVLSVPSRSDLALLLPCLHQCCMDVLSQLILCCGKDLLVYSHVILDLCLQTVVSSGKMACSDKWQTRSSVYQVLVLWVKACGWGKYLSTQHRKVLVQELVADTQTDEEDRMAKKSESGEPTLKQSSRFEGKKGKKGKKRKGDSYMELETKGDESSNGQSSEDRMNLVLWALSLSQLAVENLPYSSAQSLMSHLVTTATTVSRLSLKRPEPYRLAEARKGLYQAVAVCLLSPLDYHGNRNDAVSHYQLTNSALHLLARARHGEDAQIQAVCVEALTILKSSANLKGPVIRKVMDYDDSGVEDVSQLMREKEQMSDNMEDLRQKLMTSEMENEQQSRLISSLREQITSLKTQASTVVQPPNSTTHKESMSQSKDLSEEDEDDNIDDNAEDDDDDDEEKNVGSRVDNRNVTNTRSNIYKHSDSETVVKGSNHESESNGVFLEQTKPSTSKQSSSNSSVKQKELNADVSKTLSNSNQIEDMMMDFVDAPPDS